MVRNLFQRRLICGDKLCTYFHKYFTGARIKSAYEAGFSGFFLHHHLIKNGIENIRMQAASIEISSRDRLKTDKRDATKIAIQLSTGRLRGIAFLLWIDRLLKKDLNPCLRYHVEALVEQWHALHKKIQEVRKKLKSQAELDRASKAGHISRRGKPIVRKILLAFLSPA